MEEIPMPNLEKTQTITTKKEGSKSGIRVLAIVHFVIVLYLFYVLVRIIKSNFLVDDPVLAPILRDAMSYVSIIATSVIMVLNIIAGISLILNKKWGWWISGVYLVSQLLTKIIALIYSVYIEYQMRSVMLNNEFLRFDLISDRILKNLYLIVIISFLIILLFHNYVCNILQTNSLNKRRNLIIISVLGFGFMFINGAISFLTNLFF